MADDLQRLSVQFTADIRDFEKSIAKLEGMTNSTIKAITRQAREGSRAIDNVFKDLGRKASTSIAAIGAAVGTKELMGLSDTWTTLNNKIAAVSKSTGMQARSMSDLVKGADDARSSIESYADLYAKLMRSSASVAKNEEEVARVTNIVSKAFIAGGAAASEQAAGVLQLGQALGSGFLQGDELRSIRENAPLLAEAIAKEFNTTIAGLKDLGSQGKLTSDRVFKAFLDAGSSIEQQFAATNATMADGFTRIKNALTEYVGIGGQASGVSQSIAQGLILIADNFDKVASAGMVVVGVIAGQLVGRSLPSLLKYLLDAKVAAKELIAALRAAQSLGGVLTAIGGSGAVLGLAGAVVGGAVLYALNNYMQKSAEAAERTKTLQNELKSLGLVSTAASEKVAELSKATGDLGSAENLRRVKMLREELDRMRNGSFYSKEPNIPGLQKQAHQNVSGGDDEKAADKIDEFLRKLKELPVLAFVAGKEMQNLRDTLDLTAPLTKLTYQVEDFAQNMKGNLINAKIKGEDLISPDVEKEIHSMDLRISRLHDRNNKVSEESQQAINKLWEEYKNGSKTIEQVEQELRKMGDIGEGTISRLISVFKKYTETVGLTKDALSEANKELIKFKAQQAVDYVKGTAVGQWLNQVSQVATANKYFEEVRREQEEHNKKTKKQLNYEDRKKQLKKDYENRYKISADLVTENNWDDLTKNSLAHDERIANEGKKPNAEKKNDYEKLTDSMKERIAALNNEKEAISQINPFVNDYGFALEKAKAKHELLTDAQKSGIEITDKVEKSIDELATTYARGEAELAKAKARQDEVRQKLEAFKDVTRDVSRTFIDGLIQGKKATEALGDALMRLGQRWLEGGFDKFLDYGAKRIGESQGNTGGFWGGLGKVLGLFDTGGYTGNGGTYEPAGIVHGGEYVFSRRAVQNAGVGNLEALHSRLKGYADGGFVGGAIPKLPYIPSARELQALKTRNTETERAFRVSVTPSKYFDVHVEEISSRITSSSIEQYDKILDHTVGAKLDNGRTMGRF